MEQQPRQGDRVQVSVRGDTYSRDSWRPGTVVSTNKNGAVVKFDGGHETYFYWARIRREQRPSAKKQRQWVNPRPLATLADVAGSVIAAKSQPDLFQEAQPVAESKTNGMNGHSHREASPGGNVSQGHQSGSVEVVTITKEMAERLLEFNTINRPLRRHHVAELARQMKDGLWRFNGDSIRLCADGILDGQHRLHAVIASGVSISVILVGDLPRDVYDTMDSGLRRTRADVLSANGETHAKAIAAALAFVDNYYRENMEARRAPANSEILALREKYPGVRDSVLKVNAVGRKRGFFPVSVLAGLHYVFSQLSSDAADRFVEDLVKGTGLEGTDPVYLLRERLVKNMTSKAKLTAPYIAALAIKAWNHRRNGKGVRNLVWRSDGDASEAFPVAR